MTLLTFVIPVRHMENAPNWPALKQKLRQTANSIANQTHPDWRAVVVANAGADLPAMPSNFSVVSVDFPPNPLYKRGGLSEDAFHGAVRLDKGRRILAGMLSAPDSRFFMTVDDDDFISARLVDFVARHDHENGWVINDGYIWDDGGSILYVTDTFNNVCGTSLIIRSDLFGTPANLEVAEPEWIKTMLGSHKLVIPILEAQKTPLKPLPFRGAVYRVGQATSHSGAGSLLRTYLFNKGTMKNPGLFIGNLMRLRFLNLGRKREFFGVRED